MDDLLCSNRKRKQIGNEKCDAAITKSQLCGTAFGSRWWVEAGKGRGHRNRKEMITEDKERKVNPWYMVAEL